MGTGAVEHQVAFSRVGVQESRHVVLGHGRHHYVQFHAESYHADVCWPFWCSCSCWSFNY